MDKQNTDYEQKIGYSRGSLWAPFHAVGMVARIGGKVPIENLRNALWRLQILYPALASRVRLDQTNSAWLTKEGVGNIPLEIKQANSRDDWAKLFLEQERLPFAIERGPLAHFFALQEEESTDLVAIAPHVICDGYSMTHVMTDLVALLNNPTREVRQPDSYEPPTWRSVPHSPYDNLLMRGFIKIANRLWQKSREVIRQDEYEKVNQYYWGRRQNCMLAYELPPSDTLELANRCRKNGVSITGALIAAFHLAQGLISQSKQDILDRVMVAVNIRDRLVEHPGKVMGVYASSIDFTLRPTSRETLWDVARYSHTRTHQALENRNKIIWPLILGDLDPAITDSLLASLCTDRWGRQLDLLTRVVRIGIATPGIDVSNIGRIDLPDLGMPYRLENLIPLPPISPGGGLALNVLTVNNRMNIVLKFREDQFDTSYVSKLADHALGYLTDDE